MFLKSMKNLFKSLLFIAIALLATDRIGGKIMEWVNRNTHDISGPKLRYLANDANEDIILLGTSRCNFHYVPSILSDSTGLSAYNGGIDASDNIFAHYFMLNQVLTHHVPKVVCLELMASDYERSEHPFKTIGFFAPYIGRSERADSVFRRAGNYWQYRASHLYRYNAKAISNLCGLIIDKQQGSQNGYIPMPRPKFFPKQAEPVQTPTETDTLKLQYVQKFISLCKEKHIQLVFTVSPAYSTTDTHLYDTLKNVAETNGIPFLDYHTRQLFIDQPELFKDPKHLWDKGARLYTSIFAHDLKQYLNL